MASAKAINTVTLKQATDLIIHTGDKIRYLLRSEPGIGKSAQMEALRKHFGDSYAYAYIDGASQDVGDTAMPAVNRELRITEYYTNAIFQFHVGKPVILMIDEWGKMNQATQNMLHSLLEVNNPRIGNNPLPAGSRVLLTTNWATDGLGDNMKAHTWNRVTVLDVAKPTADEWLLWAADKGDIAPEVMSFVYRFPHVMASYIDGDEDNLYIFNPRKPAGAFVSPRSLEKASDIVKQRDKICHNSLRCALVGTLGESGAADLMAFINYQDELPKWKDIIEDPKGAAIPDTPGACAMLAFGAVQRVDSTTMDAFMTYLKRMSTEWQSVFCVHIAKDPKKQNVAFSSTQFANWIRENADIL